MKIIPTHLIAPLYNPATFAIPGAVDELLLTVREQYPLAKAEVPGYDPHWIISRHADIQAVSKQNDLFHNADRSATLIPQVGEDLVKEFTDGDYNLFRSLVQLDGDEHKSHRRILFAALGTGAIEKLRDKLSITANEQLDTLRKNEGNIEFAKAMSSLYPLHAVMDFIGIPRQHQRPMLERTQWLFSGAEPEVMRPGSDPTQPDGQHRTWKIVLEEFDSYFSTLMKDRQKSPREDLASLIANGEINGDPLLHSRAISYFAILATAGHDSTAHTTATAMWLLAENPALFANLKADSSLIPNFVEEAIRWTTPVKHFVRHATEDCELAGETIAKGDRLYLSYPSGNRDELEFDEPFHFSLERKKNRHVGFGHGGHVCLGQHFARLEMKVLWETLLPHLKSVEMTGEGQLIASEFVSGPKSVPIKYSLE